MSAVDWQALTGSDEQTAQCALLDELINQTARLADEQRTANLIAIATSDLALQDVNWAPVLTEIKARLGLTGGLS